MYVEDDYVLLRAAFSFTHYVSIDYLCEQSRASLRLRRSCWIRCRSHVCGLMRPYISQPLCFVDTKLYIYICRQWDGRRSQPELKPSDNWMVDRFRCSMI